ncbi:MAG: hypothetical protein R3B71_01800 [Candidatus Gracilibacteria bacterium]
MPPQSGPQKRNDIEIGLDKKKITAHLESFKPSEKFKEQRRKLNQRLAKTAAQESAEKQKADQYLEKSLESLDEEEKGTYETTVDEAIAEILEKGSDDEKLKGIRVQILGSVFTPELFKQKYKEWQKQYESEAKTPGFDKSEEEFVVERGKEFIVKNRDLIIQGRTKHRLEELGEKEEDEEKEKTRREELTGEVMDFVEAHEEEILSGKTDVMALRDQFLQIFYDHGHTEEEKLPIEQLFWEIVGDIEYASIMEAELDATAGVMMDMSFMNLTPEEWERRRQKSLKENAEGELEEALEDMTQYNYAASGAILASPETSLNSVKDIENKSGVHLERVAIPNEPGRYVYKIDFPHFKGIYEPFMEIRFPKGSKDLSQATYVIEDRYKDPGSGGVGQPLRRQGDKTIPTYEYSAKDVSTVLARLQLDRLLTDVVKESGDAGLTKESVNALLTDADLQKMTEQLLGFQFKDKPLLPPHLRKCKNFLKVLARADGRSFQERVKDMKIALNDAQLAPHLKKIFSRPGSEIMDVQSVIGEAKILRGGIEIDS